MNQPDVIQQLKIKSKKGFNLLELLIGLGVASALLLLGFASFQIVQSQGRDIQRLGILQDMVEEINDYRVQNLQVPMSENVSFSSTSFLIEGTQLLQFNGPLTSGESSGPSSTQYYYESTQAGFILCAELESGVIESAGTVPCPDSI